MPSIVALIPARSGSQRIKDKNIKLLAGKPLIYWTIKAAQDSGIFEDIVVSTDSQQYAEIARSYGANVPGLRPERLSKGDSPDIGWVQHTLGVLDTSYACFAILRPTNPFRTTDTILRAWNLFDTCETVDSIRAVELCKQHPAKMWVDRYGLIQPILPFLNGDTPWHSTPYQSLPEVYAQNASLEIAWASILIQTHSISGVTIVPFMIEGYEGFDLNTQDDWDYAEYLLEKGKVRL